MERVCRQTSVARGAALHQWLTPHVEKVYLRAGVHRREIIEHCRGEEAGGFTPSDFPDADLTQKELDELLDELSDYAE